MDFCHIENIGKRRETGLDEFKVNDSLSLSNNKQIVKQKVLPKITIEA
jgi:hypothetical protein